MSPAMLLVLGVLFIGLGVAVLIFGSLGGDDGESILTAVGLVITGSMMVWAGASSWPISLAVCL